MTKPKSPSIESLLGDAFVQSMIKELGIERSPSVEQAELISVIGGNIIERVTIEILKIIPDEEVDTFRGFIASEDFEGLRNFLATYIPDFDEFVRHYAQFEFDKVKTRMHMILQGVDTDES